MGKFNPFNPNATVAPNLFAGRTQQVLHVLNKLEHVRQGMSASFVLHGERGIGKTALARLIKHFSSAKDPLFSSLNFLTTYYSVDKGQDLRSVLQEAMNALTDQLPSTAIARLTERVGSIFKGGKFSFGAFSVDLRNPQDGTPAEAKRQLKDQAVSVLTNILKSLENPVDILDKADGILVILDEIHNLDDLEGAAQVLRSIATTLDVNGMGKVSFLVIGYSDPVQAFFSGDPSAQRHFDSLLLGIMPKVEAIEVLEKGFKLAGVTYDTAAMEKNIVSTGGYPHAIQVLGRHLVEFDSDGNIAEDDWSSATYATAAELQGKDFSHLYGFSKKATMREKVLDAMAIIGRPITKGELANILGKTIYQQAYLGELKNSGAVKEDPATGFLQLHSQLFRTSILLHVIPRLGTDKMVKSLVERYWNTSEQQQKELDQIK